MSRDSGRWALDLLAVFLFTGIAAVPVLLGLNGSLLRIVLVAPLVLVLPGYALVALLYPERRPERVSMFSDAGESVKQATDPAEGLLVTERFVLAVTASVLIVPFVGLVANFTVGLTVGPILVGTVAVTLLLTSLAFVRRARLPATKRFVVPSIVTLAGRTKHLFGSRSAGLMESRAFEVTSSRERLLNLVLLVSVLTLVGSVGFAMADPFDDGEEFTEFYLLTQDESGAYVADDYPQQFDAGEARPITIAVANHEGAEQTYTVVTKLQRVDRTANGTIVTEQRELDRFTTTVGAGETTRTEREIQPSLSGSRLRVVYLLYEGEPPAQPTRENAYRSTHLWITVRGGATASVAPPSDRTQLTAGGH